MTIHGLRAEFQPSNLTSSATSSHTAKVPEVIKPSNGEHEGIPSLHKNSSALTGFGQTIDIKS